MVADSVVVVVSVVDRFGTEVQGQDHGNESDATPRPIRVVVCPRFPFGVDLLRRLCASERDR